MVTEKRNNKQAQASKRTNTGGRPGASITNQSDKRILSQPGPSKEQKTFQPMQARKKETSKTQRTSPSQKNPKQTRKKI